MEPLHELTLGFADVDALSAEFEKNLRKARTFVAGAAGLAERSLCTLVLIHPDHGGALRLRAEVVFVKSEEPGKGLGLCIDPCDAAVLERLRAFIAGQVEASPAEAAPAGDPIALTEEGLRLLGGEAGEPEDREEIYMLGEEEECVGEGEDGGGEGGAEESGEVGGEESGEVGGEESAVGTVSLQERIRRLPLAMQQRVAAHGTMQERLVLERTFGSAVWESLLSNPRITPPEVARIAKKGSLPKPLIDTIAANSAWLASPEVQRALLSNPRTGSHLIPRLLRALSRADLMLVPAQSSYPMAVRTAAKKMLGG